MTQKEINKVLLENRIHVWKSYYFDVVFGVLLCISPAIIISIGDGFTYKNFTSNTIIGLSLSISLIMIYGYSTERKLLRVKTNYNKSENINIINRALNDLGWKYKIKKNTVDISENNGFFIDLLRIYIIPIENEIVLNIMIQGGARGHLPYCFGLKTFYKRKLHNAILKATPIK